MDPITAIAGAVKAWLEFLCTPEGQEVCKANREILVKFTTTLDNLVAKAGPHQ